MHKDIFKNWIPLSDLFYIGKKLYLLELSWN